MKICSTCKETKPYLDFNTHPRMADKYNYRCKDCEKRRRQELRLLHPEKTKDKQLKTNLGLSVEDYKTLSNGFGNKCMICSVESDKMNLCVDHCHKTNLVRGLLCRQCNAGLGHFKDNNVLAAKAIAYLLFPPAKNLGIKCTPRSKN